MGTRKNTETYRKSTEKEWNKDDRINGIFVHEFTRIYTKGSSGSRIGARDERGSARW